MCMYMLYFCFSYFYLYKHIQFLSTLGAIVAMIIWWLDLQLPMQSVLIITDVVSSNLDQGEVYNIMW